MRPVDTRPDAPWKQRYRIRQTHGFVASGTPARGLATSNRSGVTQLYAWDVESGALTQLTNKPTGVSHGTISGDGQFVYYLDDAEGNELGHFVRLPFEGGTITDITPDMPLYSSFSISTSADGGTFSFVTSDDAGFHAFISQTTNPTERRLFYECTQLVMNLALSANGNSVVVATSEGAHGLNFNLRAFDANGTAIGTLSDGPDQSVTLHSFSPISGDTRVLAASNRTGNTRPLIWDLHSGERYDLALDSISGDIEPQGWSRDGEQILLLQVAEAQHQLYLYHVAQRHVTRLEHPSGTFSGVSFGQLGEIMANWQNATHPQQLVALDMHTGAVLRTLLSAEDTPPAQPWRSVRFPSTDGVTIQGWLALPEGEGPFPTILETHGGPTYALTEVFHSACQAWLDHGYAFLSINYRGSTTFGKAFEESIWGRLGSVEVDDMAAARSWLVEQGIADPEAILLTGWSYGGYLTLQALGRTPKLWAGGMAGIAIADWRVQFEDTASTLRGYQIALFGGTPEEKPEAYAASSPISYVAQVQAPVLVIQGSNDTRCPPRPMRMYEAAMRKLGKDIEVVWFEAGHGSFNVELSVQHQELMMRWAERVLG